MRAECQSVSRCRQIKNSPPPRKVGKLNFHGSKVTNTGVVTHVSERYLQQERPTSDHLHLPLLHRQQRQMRALHLFPLGGSKVQNISGSLSSLQRGLLEGVSRGLIYCVKLYQFILI